jgi:excisionase family DNA binding protein
MGDKEMPERRELLTLKQVAEWLQISDRTVHRLIAEGKLQGLKVGRQWRFEKAEIERYIDSLAMTTTEMDKRRAKEHQRELRGTK